MCTCVSNEIALTVNVSILSLVRTCVCTRKFYAITQFQPESNHYGTDEGSCVATEAFGFPNHPWLASEF